MTRSVPDYRSKLLAHDTHASLEVYPRAENAQPLTTGRVMLCMTPDRSAATELMAAAFLAQELQIPWFAAYVVCPPRGWRRVLAQRESEELAHNIKLASTLGASVVRVSAPDVTDGLAGLVSREGVTHAVFGPTVRSRSPKTPGPTVQGFVRRARGVEIRVVAEPQPVERAADRVVEFDGVSRRVSILIWGAAILSAVGLMAIAPWPTATLIAVAAACGWSWWLERRRQ